MIIILNNFFLILQHKKPFYISILKFKKAYSLVELSVVITIMSILMMGVASIVNNSMKKAQKNETQEKMQTIYNAMGKFLLKEKRLPCPAQLNLVENSIEYGKEANKTNNNCNTVSNGIFSNNNNFFVGAVPTTTLELPSDMAKDEFGNKITYIISKNSTIATTLETLTPAIFPSADIGFGANNYSDQMLNVFEYSNDTSARKITSEAIFILISHGNNKNCAYPANSTSVISSCPIADEITNSANKYSVSINNNIIYNSTNPNFDDIVLFKTKNQLANDLNVHHLILCNTTTFSDATNYVRKVGSTTTQQNLFYEQNLFHNNQDNSCQLICGKYGVLFQSKPNCPND